MNNRQERTAVLNLRLHTAERRAVEAIMIREGYANLSETARILLREALKNHGFEAIGLADIMAVNLQADEARS